MKIPFMAPWEMLKSRTQEGRVAKNGPVSVPSSRECHRGERKLE